MAFFSLTWEENLDNLSNIVEFFEEATSLTSIIVNQNLGIGCVSSIIKQIALSFGWELGHGDLLLRASSIW